MPNTHTTHDALCLRMLGAIQTYRTKHGYPPTLPEVGAALGIASKGHLSYIRNTLASRGWLTFQPGRQRTLLLTVAGHAALEAHAQEVEYATTA